MTHAFAHSTGTIERGGEARLGLDVGFRALGTGEQLQTHNIAVKDEGGRETTQASKRSVHAEKELDA